MRLSASSFAGTARTLVAVGSCSDAVMFFAMAFAAPRSGRVVSAVPSPAPGCADFAGLVVPAAGLLVGGSSPVRDDVVRPEPAAADDGAALSVSPPEVALPLPLDPLPAPPDPSVRACPLPDEGAGVSAAGAVAPEVVSAGAGGAEPPLPEASGADAGDDADEPAETVVAPASALSAGA
ncbi:MAG: hypothetical protein K0S40_59 [Actinomycetospora sp.]|nr:hypothetical protein [Actinomycetospora sp.]